MDVRYRCWILGVLMATSGGACAAPLQRMTSPLNVSAPPMAPVPVAVAGDGLARPRVGLALGGGSARGLAHLGVIRWLEEHRIPIDLVSGTSMGGLIGGAYATGMDAQELTSFIEALDWDELLGSSNFAHKNIRRKTDARAFPSRLEFGARRGIVAPPSLNTGEYVELLFDRIAAPYYELDSFDDLPTPFRAVAVDLVTATEVVLQRGVLSDAMRATMSLPMIFPPVELDGRVLVDGGAMNNVPADVARGMGADRVIGVNVGDLKDRDRLEFTLLGLAGATIDAMTRASTRRTLASADVIINVPLDAYGSLDWRRVSELAAEGYRAAEAMSTELLPLAVSESEFDAWRQRRVQRRRTALPVPAAVRQEGFAANDRDRLDALLAHHVGVPLDITVLEADLAMLTGLDRYETVTWQLARDQDGTQILVVRGRSKTYAPPFMMLGLNLENTTSSDFRISATGRYLAFDVLGSGAELRVDATVGSNPGLAAEYYRPWGSSPLFVAPYAALTTAKLNFVQDDAVVARYDLTRTRAGLNVGVNLGPWSDLRAGVFLGHSSTSIAIGDPGLPEVEGRERGAEVGWRLDTHDSPVIPSRGIRAQVRLSHMFEGPDIALQDETTIEGSALTQLAGDGVIFKAIGERGRLFAYGGAGTSFNSHPIATNQFALGTPFRLGAYSSDDLRGAHHYVATAGYMRQIARLPDFLGGPVFAGGWLENGDAFEEWSAARWRTHASGGVVMDTLLGPVVIGASAGFDGRWRTYLGVGRVFR